MPRRWRRRDGRVEMDVETYGRQRRSAFSTVVTGLTVGVFVDAPLEVCEERDVKGLYAKARAGIITDFTGIDDPYEEPQDPEIVCKTGEESVQRSLQKVLDYLAEEDYIEPIDASI